MTIRILVVEDEEDIRKGICIELAHTDWQGETTEILGADDIDSALTILNETTDIRLVLTDLMMPSGRDAGLQLISQMQSHRAWQRIPVIVLSARAQANDILEALRLGAIDYLVKPYAPEDLVDRVKRAVNVGLALQHLTPEDQIEQQRKQLVEAMNISLLYWELSTHRSKVQFADQSGLWSVYIDSRGTCSTKTLDKYLHHNSLPAKPKVHLIIKSLRYVLEHCEGHASIRAKVENALSVISD